MGVDEGMGGLDDLFERMVTAINVDPAEHTFSVHFVQRVDAFGLPLNTNRSRRVKCGPNWAQSETT